MASSERKVLHSPARTAATYCSSAISTVADLTRTFRVAGAAVSAGQSRSTNSAIDVGQVENLRGGWLPPPAGSERGSGPIAKRPQLNKLPHKVAPRDRRGVRSARPRL